MNILLTSSTTDRSRFFHGRTRGVPKALLALLLLLAVVGGVQAQDAPADTVLVEAFVTVHVPGVIKFDMFTRQNLDGRIYMPFGDLMGRLRFKIASNAERTAFMADGSNGSKIVVLPMEHRLIQDNDTIDFEPKWARVLEGELYMRDSLAAIVLGVPIQYDEGQALVVISAFNSIPIVELATTQRMWNQLKPGEGSTEIGPSSYSGTSLLGFPLFRWGANASSNLSQGVSQASLTNSASLDMSIPFLYGQLTLGGYGSYNSSNNQTNVALGSWAWHYTMHGTSLLSSIGLNGIGWTGVQLSLANGGLYANNEDFPEYVVEGVTSPGWFVELHRSGALYAAQRADTATGAYRFTFNRPYGREMCTVVLISPFSDRDTIEYEVGNDLRGARPGSVVYNLSAAVDTIGSSHSPAQAGLTLQAGVTDWLSVSSTSTLWTHRIDSISSVFKDWREQAQVMFGANAYFGEQTDAYVQYSLNDNRIGGALTTVIGPMPISFSASSIAVTEKYPLADAAIAIGSGVSLSTGEWGIGLAASAIYSEGLLVSYPALSLAMPIARMSLSTALVKAVGYIQNTTEPGTRVGDASRVAPVTTGTLSLPIIRDLPLDFTAGYDHRAKRFTTITGRTNYRIAPSVRLSLGVAVPRAEIRRAQVFVTVGYSTDWFDAGSYAGASATALGSIGTHFSGAFAVNSAGVTFGRTGMAMQSQIYLRAYNDRNGNGKLDDGEEMLATPPMASVRYAGSLNTLMNTTPEGWFKSVPAGVPLVLDIDQWGLAGESFFPVERIQQVMLVTGEVAVIDIPFRRGYTVTGMCQIERMGRDGKPFLSGQGLSAMRVWLEPVSGGTIIEGEIFEDGSILMDGVPEGSYDIKFDPAQLEYRQLEPRDVIPMTTIDVGSTELPEIILIPHVQSQTPQRER